MHVWKLKCQTRSDLCNSFVEQTHRIAVLFCLLSCTTAARGQEWSITTSDFKTQSCVNPSVFEGGVRFRARDSNTDQTLPLNNLLVLRRSISVVGAIAGPFWLRQPNGDYLSGTPTRLQEEQFTWSNPCLGEINLPVNQLASIDRDRLGESTKSPKQDTVTLSNHDVSSGAITELVNGIVTVQTEDAAKAIPLSQVKSMYFASTSPTTGQSGSPRFRVSISDGSLFTAKMITTNGQHLDIMPMGANTVAMRVNKGDIISIERINGAVCWLSSQTPVENVQADYFGSTSQWPTRFDSAVDGQPLICDHRHFDHGIGVHAYSRLTFAIDPQWIGFRTQYAIHLPDQKPRPYADVTLRVKLDGKIVHEQSHLHQGIISPVLNLSIEGKKRLILECDYGDNGGTQAAVNWLEPAFLKTQLTNPSNAKK